MTGYVPEQRAAMLFRQRIELPSTTSSAAGVVVLTVPVYDVVWVEVTTAVATNDVYITVEPDTTGGNIISPQISVLVGETPTFWRLVNGAPANIGLANGSHTLTIKATDKVSGAHGVVTGHIVLHGVRRT